MKIEQVEYNNRTKSFSVLTSGKTLVFPYANLEIRPSIKNPIVDCWVDQELANEAFTYQLKDGEELTVHIEQVLAYNQDSNYLTGQMLYKLTVAAQKQLKQSDLSTREIIRRLGTSPAQFYRLMDQTNTSKSINKMVNLLQVLGCEVEVVVKEHTGEVQKQRIRV